MTDHQTTGAKPGEDRPQHIRLGAGIAHGGAAIPVGSVGFDHRVAVRGDEPAHRLGFACLDGRVGVLAGGNPRLGKRRALAEVVLGQHEPRRLERSHARKIVGQRRPIPQIDLGQRQPGEHRRRATVHEERIVDHDGHRQREQPASVDAVRRERHAMAEVADRKALVEFGAGIRTVSCDPLGALLLAHAGGLFRGIGLELARCHVAHVPEQVHRLVVAERHVKLSARRGGLALQAHQQIHHLARVLAAIEQVAGADEMCPAAGPVEIAVHDANRLEQLDEVVVGAVHVGEGDHTLDASECHLRGLRGSDRPRGACHTERDQRGHHTTADPPNEMRANSVQ